MAFSGSPQRQWEDGEELRLWRRRAGLLGEPRGQGSDIPVPRPNGSEIPEIMICRILMFMWSFGPLLLPYN